jgi:hypothetical protein
LLLGDIGRVELLMVKKESLLQKEAKKDLNHRYRPVEFC